MKFNINLDANREGLDFSRCVIFIVTPYRIISPVRLVVHMKLEANYHGNAVMPVQNRRFFNNAICRKPFGFREGPVDDIEDVKQQHKHYGRSKNREKPEL